jgi:hypothetical protein
MKTTYLLLIAALLATTAVAQETLTPNPSAGSRWTPRLSAGIQSFTTSGIPKSRNQINVESLQTGESISYDQQSGIAGLALEAGLYYSLRPKMRLGLFLNTFRDDEEYIYASQEDMNPAAILEDSLNSLTIRNRQSYANVGLAFEYDFTLPSLPKHKLSLAIGAGRTINRTPNRSEYDAFAENNFLPYELQPSGDIWYVTHTRFHNGWFVMPSLSYGYNLRKDNWLHFSLSPSFHWLKTTKEIVLLDKVSSGSVDPASYTVNSMQIKLGYSF